MFKGMDSNTVALLMLLMGVLIISTYAKAQTGLHPSLMKGSIIALEDSNVYICIGSRDGAKVGQELDVYNIGAKPMVYKGPPSFERKHTGKIRTIEVLDKHFARAILVSRKAEIAYIVELTHHLIEHRLNMHHAPVLAASGVRQTQNGRGGRHTAHKPDEQVGYDLQAKEGSIAFL